MSRRAFLTVALSILLVAAVVLPGLWREVRLAQASRPLLQALLLRISIHDLPLGPGTPPIWALARSAVGAPLIAPRPPDAVVTELKVEQALEQTVSQLTQMGGRPRLAGIAAGTRGDYSQAAELLTQAQRARPQDVFTSLAAGNVLDAQGDRPAAIAAWDEAGARRGIAVQLYRWGSQLARQGARPRAEAALTLATEVDPTFADPFYALGGFYWGQDNAKAAEMFRTALAAGGLAPYFQLMAEARLALLEDRPADAVAPLEQATQLRPDDPESSELLGNALRRLGRTDEAIVFFRRAAALNPTAPWPLIQLGQVHLLLGNYEPAIASLTQAIARRADLPVAFELLARAYTGVGQPQQAAAAWRQAVALAPQNTTYLRGLADALAQAGQLAEAAEVYQALLQLNPDDVGVQRSLRGVQDQLQGQP